MLRTKITLAVAAVMACAAAPTAMAADMCTTLKQVLAVGARDKAFTSQQSSPYQKGEYGVIANSQIDDFLCKVSIEGDRGFYACSRKDADNGQTEAAALAGSIEHCLGISPTVTKSDYDTSYKFGYRAKPPLIVYVSGTPGKLVFLNVIAD